MLKFTLRISLFHLQGLTNIQLGNQKSSVAFFTTLTNKQKCQKERNFFSSKTIIYTLTNNFSHFPLHKKKIYIEFS